MKILVLSSHTPSLFWIRKDMMLSFIALGHEVVAVGNEPEDEWGPKFHEIGIKYLAANIQRNGTNPIRDLKTLSSLKKIIKRECPDKIFAYQAKTVIYGCLAAKSVGVEIFPMIAGVGSVFLSDSFKGRIVRFILKKEYKAALKYASKVFFQNSDDVELFEKLKILNHEKIVMLRGSGVNLRVFIPEQLPLKTTFLFTGRLIKDKGVVEYLEAARIVKKNHSNVRFLLVGPFDSNPTSLKPEQIQEYVDEGIIEFFGEQTDVRPYLKQCSVFVLPSYREGTPKTVLEAMATGRAIITTDAPGCKETVRDGVNGYLVPVKDVSAIVDKMLLFINSPEKIQEMAQSGRKIAEEIFDVEKVNKVIIDTMNI